MILRSRKQETAEAMLAALEKSLVRQVEKGRMEDGEKDAVLARVSATSRLADLAECDLVIESIVEDLST